MRYVYFLAVILFFRTAFADGVVDPAVSLPEPSPEAFVPPEWLASVMLYVSSLPGVGPIVVEVLKWLGVVASIMTALATAFFAIMKSLSRVLALAKLLPLAEKVDKVYKLVGPYLMYFSVYNVQKGDLKKPNAGPSQ